MEDLIKAMNIFNKYIPDESYPTYCEHDVLRVNCNPELVSQEDIDELSELRFSADYIENDFYSFKFGSC